MSNQYGEFVNQVKQTTESILSQVHTCVPGKIVSFDGGTCQATVLPSMKIKTPKASVTNIPKELPCSLSTKSKITAVSPSPTT